VEVTLTGLSPFTDAVFVSGEDLGAGSVPSGACAGVDTGLLDPALVRRVSDVDGDGAFTLSADIGAGRCGGRLAALDLTSCEMSASIPLDGSAGSARGSILWSDLIQDSGSVLWGFDGMAVERPIGTPVSPSDAAGANLSQVADPAGGGGLALRHFGTFDGAGARAQVGLWSFANPAFDAQAKSPEGVWVAQEWFFPEAIDAGGDDIPWINLWDWHSTTAGGAERWDTTPGLMLAEDGSMRVRFEWGATWMINPASESSTVSLPVGRWFDVEMHYTWTTSTTTVSLWIDGELALEQSGVQTADVGHSVVEMYSKFYGSSQWGTPWSPTPSIRYTRNVRVSDGPITVR